MKKYTVGVMLLLALAGCKEDKAVDFQDMVMKNGVFYEHESGAPYSGDMVFKDNEGNVSNQVELKNGRYNGDYRSQFPDGGWLSGKYKNNLLNGQVVIYDQDGSVLDKAFYENGIRILNKGDIDKYTRLMGLTIGSVIEKNISVMNMSLEKRGVKLSHDKSSNAYFIARKELRDNIVSMGESCSADFDYRGAAYKVSKMEMQPTQTFDDDSASKLKSKLFGTFKTIMGNFCFLDRLSYEINGDLLADSILEGINTNNYKVRKMLENDTYLIAGIESSVTSYYVAEAEKFIRSTSLEFKSIRGDLKELPEKYSYIVGIEDYPISEQKQIASNAMSEILNSIQLSQYKLRHETLKADLMVGDRALLHYGKGKWAFREVRPGKSDYPEHHKN